MTTPASHDPGSPYLRVLHLTASLPCKVPHSRVLGVRCGRESQGGVPGGIQSAGPWQDWGKLLLAAASPSSVRGRDEVIYQEWGGWRGWLHVDPMGSGAWSPGRLVSGASYRHKAGGGPRTAPVAWASGQVDIGFLQGSAFAQRG